MPRNRLPWMIKNYRPKGWRKQGRQLQWILDMWDRNGSKICLTPC